MDEQFEDVDIEGLSPGIVGSRVRIAVYDSFDKLVVVEVGTLTGYGYDPTVKTLYWMFDGRDNHQGHVDLALDANPYKVRITTW